MGTISGHARCNVAQGPTVLVLQAGPPGLIPYTVDKSFPQKKLAETHAPRISHASCVRAKLEHNITLVEKLVTCLETAKNVKNRQPSRRDGMNCLGSPRNTKAHFMSNYGESAESFHVTAVLQGMNSTGSLRDKLAAKHANVAVQARNTHPKETWILIDQSVSVENAHSRHKTQTQTMCESSSRQHTHRDRVSHGTRHVLGPVKKDLDKYSTSNT